MTHRLRGGLPAGLLRASLPAALVLGLVVVLLGSAMERGGVTTGRLAAVWAQEPGHEGFGASTPGGAGGSVVRVTTLDDAGPGSLREALEQGHRTIVFDVGGTIALAGPVYVRGPFITIDGFTAPAPGITLRGDALVIRGTQGAHDVVVRGLRIRDAALDGIQIANGAYNVVIDHVSVTGSGDGNIDITEGAHDVTVSWSILAAPASDKNMLVKYDASRVSLHHNLFAYAEQRNPVVSTDDAGTPAGDTTADIRNNVIWEWGQGVGIMIFKGARANVVANYTASPSSGTSDQAQGVVVCDLNCDGDLSATALAAVSGNLSGYPLARDMNADGNVLDPFPAPAVTQYGPQQAAEAVLAQAGARPLDTVDEQLLAGIALPTRPQGPNVSVSFLAVDVTASGLAITDRVTNGGTQPAAPTSTRFFLSVDGKLDAHDIALGSRSVGSLDADASSVGTLTVPIPAGIAAGTYVVIAQADGGGAIAETNEADNVTPRAVSLALPDLLVAALSAPPATSPGATISVSDTTRNRSAVPAPATTTRFFLSADSRLGGGDLLLGSRAVGSLAGGAESPGATALTIPLGTPGGAYYLLAQADGDDVGLELSESNNLTARPIQVGGPDLAISALTVPGTGKPGLALTVSDTTRNAGSMASPATTTRYFLSPDAAAGEGDVVLGARSVPGLAPGAASVGSSVSVTIPASTPSGTYFIVARADATGGAAEIDEGNNELARPIEIGFDLSVSAISAPNAAAAGSPISIGETTNNLGPGTAPPSTTAFFLSITSTLGPNAVPLGSRPVPALARGASSTATSPVTLPPGLGGIYYVIALANAGTGLNGNNAKAKAISIGPDLTVTALTSPSSARAGAPVAVSDTTRNAAAIASGASTTRYFLSTTSALGPGAIGLGARAVPALGAGVTNTGTATVVIPSGTAPGNYYLIAQADGDDVLAESSEANNLRSRAITLTN